MLTAITRLLQWLVSEMSAATTASGTDMMEDGGSPAPPWPPR